MQSLQERLDAMRTMIVEKASPEARAAIDQAIEDLLQSNAADAALKVGDRIPSFHLTSDEGNPVSSSYLLEDGPLVLVFYRGFWCPYCNLELQALEDAVDAIEARGASLVAVSPQTAANSRRTRRELDLSYPILSDPGARTIDAFRIGWTVPESIRPYQRAVRADVPRFNGDDSWRLPMPATYVIGRDGEIVYASVHPDYRNRPEPEELLSVLDISKLDFQTHDVHPRYGERATDADVTAPEESTADEGAGELRRGPAWFDSLAAELEARTGKRELSGQEHSYASERLFQDHWPRSVAQEIYAARAGFGQLWTA